ncbi:hypothetical protein ACEE86_08905, partial [Proteus mirabilis]
VRATREQHRGKVGGGGRWVKGTFENLLNVVPKGSRVQVKKKPIKFTETADGKQFIEVHQPLSQNEDDDPQTMPLTFTKQFTAWYESGKVDKAKVDAEIIRRSGIPVDVTAY